MLQVIAGSEAARAIEQEGMIPQLFDKWIAASGGPKWLPLAPLDRHLSEQFLLPDQPLALMGTSSGAWRCAALCHPQPAEAHRRLQQGYIHQRYDQAPTQAEIARQCQALLEAAFEPESRQAMVTHPHRQLNLIACRGRGLLSAPRQGSVMAMAALTAAINLVGRRGIAALWQRWVFHAGSHSGFSGMSDLPTYSAQLHAPALIAALLASGSIPMVLPGVEDLAGAAPGRYYDGGVTDYHLDLPALRQGGLTLYPHFYPYAAPGWFDKSLPWRRAQDNFKRVVILAPSEAFIARLPGRKLPDRTDFRALSSAQRIDAWQQAASMGEALIEGFEAIRQEPGRYLQRGFG
ncbi:alpha/beta hydrolase [Ferrimonas pelagia]|uniref:Alpha/beta hydrolase n=1 Tax=Ferrimonas pelagia TaxID=1177826 RepID=A0ABP9END7_9GAMM